MSNYRTAAFRVAILAGFALCVDALPAATNTITFSITRVKEIQCNEGFGEKCPNDYYPKVEIDSQGLVDGKDVGFCCAHDVDFQPNWVFTRQADVSHTTVPIHVELFDQDDFSADEQINITSLPNKSLDIQVDLNTCTWQAGALSGLLNTQSSSTGNGKDSAQLYFLITTSAASCVDTDGDGLLDVWEKNGVNGVNLPAMGADPNKIDLFLQIDYMVAFTHTHQPLQAAVQQVVQASPTRRSSTRTAVAGSNCISTWVPLTGRG
jgi:hypothetical protein